MSIVVVLTDPAMGGVFLSWSLHFLAGHDTFFHARSNAFLDLPKNPLTDINAHNFRPNHISTAQQLPIIDQISQCQSLNFHTIYYHNYLFEDQSDNDTIINKLISCSDKILVVTNQPKHLLYEKSLRSRASTSSYQNNQEQFDDYVDQYFKDSKEHWQELGLNSVWDQREFLALNYRHLNLPISEHMDLSILHHSIDALEWFVLGDRLMPDVFKYLGIDIDPNRLDEWKKIYQIWQQNHHQRLSFLWNFDKIVDYVVAGKYMDLTRLDLDIYQEAIIQHELIYKYNLNLKTFQLEKFSDTVQLHKLLEPNIHQLNSIQHSV